MITLNNKMSDALRIMVQHHHNDRFHNAKHERMLTAPCGTLYHMKENGTLTEDGIPFLFVLPRDKFVVLRKRWSDCLSGPLSLGPFAIQLDVPVVDVTDKDMHWLNLKAFRQDIASVMNTESMSLSARYQLVIRRRAVIREYTKSFDLPDLALSSLEKSLLAREVLCPSSNDFDPDWIILLYRRLYNLDDDQSLDEVGLTHFDLNSIKTEQA